MMTRDAQKHMYIFEEKSGKSDANSIFSVYWFIWFDWFRSKTDEPTEFSISTKLQPNRIGIKLNVRNRFGSIYSIS